MNGSKVIAWTALAAWFGVPALVVLSVWVPVVNHYHVRAGRITEDVVRQARQSPPDSLLRELKEFRLMKLGPRDNRALVRVADKLLKGIVDIANFPPARIRIPFDPRDLEDVPPVWQLPVAGLVVPRILLDAYDVTGRDEFLFTARDMIMAWGLYERRSWLPRGLQWNDHAIAARAGVLTDFWRLYRHHPGYQPAVGQALLEQVERSAELLAKPRHFTFSTNHGVMQNLGLLHVSVAFPMLPHVQRYTDLALTRLRDQMPFYIDAEGVVLEHSAGYQTFGLELIAMACRYLALLHLPIPEEWRRKYERAEQVFAALRRPDGTLPTFGDTDGASDDVGPLVAVFDAQGRSETLHHEPSWVPKRPFRFYPVAGHAIWWDGLADWPKAKNLRQTVIDWSYFPGHGHKHADEMSVLVWAGGELWWTNVGYWPYVMDGRSEAESWQGANAPHLVGESAESPRSTRLLSFGWSDRVAVVDLERRGPGKYAARRQVVHITPDVWLVVDHVSSDDTLKTVTTWTTSPDVSLRNAKIPGSYTLTTRYSPLRLEAFIAGSPRTSIKEFAGSLSPFAGWQVVNGIPRPAPAIVVEQPARDSWSIVVWSLESGPEDSTRFPTDPQVLSWNNADDWRAQLPGRSGVREVGRAGDQIALRDGRNKLIETLKLTPAPDMADEVAQVRTSFAKAEGAYPGFRDLLDRRAKVTQLLVAIFLSQELFFSFIRRKHRDYYPRLRALNVVGWLGVGCWLMFSFLEAW